MDLKAVILCVKSVHLLVLLVAILLTNSAAGIICSVNITALILNNVFTVSVSQVRCTSYYV